MTDPRRPGPPEPADDAPPDNVRRLRQPAPGPTYGPTHADTYGPLFPPTPPYGTALGPQRRAPVTPPTRMSTDTRVLIVLAVLVAAAIAVVPMLGLAGFLSGGGVAPTAAAGRGQAPAEGDQSEVTTPPGPEFRSLSATQWATLISDPDSFIGDSIIVYGRLTRLATDDDTAVRALIGSSRQDDEDGYAVRASLDRTDGSWDGFAEGDEIRVYGVLRDVREDADTGDDVLVLEAAPYGVRRYQ